MKYTGMPAGMWMLFHRSFREKMVSVLGFSEEAAARTEKKALVKYQAAKDNYFALKSTDHFFFLSNHGRQLNNSAVEHIVKRHGEGVEGIRVSPHTCRHFFAQQQVKLGTDLYTISRLLGHENIGITQTYLNSLRDEEVIEIAKQKSVLMNI